MEKYFYENFFSDTTAAEFHKMMKNLYQEISYVRRKNFQIIKTNLNVLQNSGAYPKKMNYPFTLQFKLTGKCNLACKHCYNRSGEFDSETLMTPEKWCELSDIMDILHDNGTSFIVIFNALLLTKEKVKRFAKYHYFGFQISIDGSTAEIYDSFRGVTGSFDRAVNGALEISDAGIPLVIAHTVTPANLSKIEEMVNLSYKLGANSIILGEVLPGGRAHDNAEIILDDEKNFSCTRKLRSLAKNIKANLQFSDQRNSKRKWKDM